MVFASPATTTDSSDTAAQPGGVDIKSIAHSDGSGVVKYAVTAFQTVRPDRIVAMRWDLDLDGDGTITQPSDGCVVLQPVTGAAAKTKLKAQVFKDGCTGQPITTADARTREDTIKIKLLVDELHNAGLASGATQYAYRFKSVDRSGVTDEVPDAPGSLITHTFGSSGGRSSRPRAAETATPTPTASPSASPSSSVTASPTPSGSSRDTVSTGKADDSVVEPGDNVDISGGGFAGGKGLKIFLEGNATSTATASPSPTVSPSPAAATANGAQIVNFVSGPTAAGRKSGGRAAAADTVTSLGVALSDSKGNFDDDVDIPDDTNAGTYKIVVTGPNKRGGTHRVNIPITVAADVSGSTSSSSPAASNATGTATQASPVSSTGTGSGTLPATGSGNLQTIFGLGLVGVMLGSSLLLAKRVAQRRVPVAAGGRIAGQVSLVFEVPPGGSGALPDGGLRGEMQRLLARRTDRNDPDRHTDL